MNVNLTHLTINFYESGNVEFRINSPERMKIDSYHSDYPGSYYLSKNDLLLALDCMTGKSKVYPFFDDINYLIKFCTDGMKVIELSDSKPCKYLYFTFPIGKLTGLHDRIAKQLSNPENDTMEYTQSDFNEWDRLYHSKCKFNLQDILHTEFNPTTYEFTSTVEVSLKDRIKRDIKTNPELKDYLQRLIRIAHNYSTFGETVEINLSFDSYFSGKNNIPSSYYFDIRLGNQRIMNGGLIAHERNNGSYEYSMHT